jgi:prepilin-type processing-associated H-X9-DG protein
MGELVFWNAASGRKKRDSATARGPAPGRLFGSPTLSVNGRWLNNDRQHRRDSPWFTYGKTSAIRAPGPAMLWVLVDESIAGLNDAAFAFGMKSPAWIDAPGTYHNGGCGFAFADAHSENHRWLSHALKRGQTWQITNPADVNDWLWMRERTLAHSSGTMPPPESTAQR